MIRAAMALILLLVAALPARAAGLGEAERAQLAEALACVDMSIEDLGWDKRPLDDPFRLEIVNRALDEPLSLAGMAERAEAEFADDPVASAAVLAAWLAPAAGPLPEQSTDGVLPVDATFERQAPPELRAAAGALRRARHAIAGAVPSDGADALRAGAARLYLDESEEPWDSKPVLAAAARVSLPHLIAAFRELASLAAAARAWAPEGSRPRTWRLSDGTTLAFGSTGDDRHDATIVVDPGGHDTYSGSRVVIDLAGDDTYRDCGSGRLDAGLVVDLAGDDRYSGRDVTQGGAVLGVALLLDVAGNDAYESSQLSQGSGVLGVGMLFDLAGNDSYRGARFVQGFGGVSGLGALSDVSGNDTYWAGGTFKHEPLLPENYQSLSQGFGFGLRPDASGGIGVLADHAGNDLYHAEVYGQGASYWFALGVLADSAGHDKYDLFQYGQGAGIHLSAGVLLDRAGSDGYTCNNGVAQGSGHDWAVGLLWDLAGHDAYQGSGMSQGGANANGIGMLVDREGNDSYAGWNERNQGDSFPARGSVGLGVALDLAGRDKWTHGGRDGATWVRGHVGVGRDVADPPPQEAKP